MTARELLDKNLQLFKSEDHSRTKCRHCSYCINCGKLDECIDCSHYLLCSDSCENDKSSFWLLNKEVTEEKFNEARALLKYYYRALYDAKHFGD